jgi:hypothetical protein
MHPQHNFGRSSLGDSIMAQPMQQIPKKSVTVAFDREGVSNCKIS